jgi:hypothetical protein
MPYSYQRWGNNQSGHYSEAHLDQFERLQDYATVLGTTVDIAVYEAVSDFIECCVSTRLESYQRKIHET